MEHYEIIHENGEHSVGAAEDDKEIIKAVKLHHERAKKGLPAGPQSFDRETGAAIPEPAANRIVRVLVYDDHPAELSIAEQSTPEAVKKRFKDALEQSTDENGTVDFERFTFLMRPQPRVITPAHESNYTTAEARELDPALWGGDS